MENSSSESIPSENDSLTERIIKCIIEVHRTLGPGFMENIYKNSLLIELQKNNLKSEAEKEIHVSYKGKIVGIHRLDICVENKVIIELKTVEKLIKVHYCQIRSYLKATGFQIGILFNFASEKADFRRIQTS